MSFCLNCGNHKTCQCFGPPPGVQDLRHPATKWFDQQVEDGLLKAFNAGGVEDIRHLMTKAFNAGCCHACREIRDVIPRGPLNDCCKDELQFAVEDIDAICAEWLG